MPRNAALCHPIMHVIRGTREADFLLGTAGPDRIFGLSGRDDIRADAGDDIVRAGPGDDGFVAGGEGDDTLFGGPGDDFMAGSGDDDILIGGPGDDGLFGDAGRDLVWGGPGDDLLDGGFGDDVLIGGPGADLFTVDTIVASQTETIADFDRSEDKLNFRRLFGNLPDLGEPGLADDIDAVSTILDAGQGGDVILTLDTGTTIVLENMGTGFVASVADLVDDPMTQIVSEAFAWV